MNFHDPYTDLSPKTLAVISESFGKYQPIYDKLSEYQKIANQALEPIRPALKEIEETHDNIAALIPDESYLRFSNETARFLKNTDFEYLGSFQSSIQSYLDVLPKDLFTPVYSSHPGRRSKNDVFRKTLPNSQWAHTYDQNLTTLSMYLSTSTQWKHPTGGHFWKFQTALN